MNNQVCQQQTPSTTMKAIRQTSTMSTRTQRHRRPPSDIDKNLTTLLTTPKRQPNDNPVTSTRIIHFLHRLTSLTLRACCSANLATSEHVESPRYIVSYGDLGMAAVSLDSALEMIVDIATVRKAIMLIDEANVFLEQRFLY